MHVKQADRQASYISNGRNIESKRSKAALKAGPGFG